MPVFEAAVAEDGTSESPTGLAGRPRCSTGRLGSNSSGEVGLEEAEALACCVAFPGVDCVEADGGAFKIGLSTSSASVVEEPLFVVCGGVEPVSPVSSPGRASVGRPPELAVPSDELAVPPDDGGPLPVGEVELPAEDDGVPFDPVLGLLPDCGLFDVSLDPGRRNTGGPASASAVITAPLGLFGWLAASFAASPATLVSRDSCGFH